MGKSKSAANGADDEPPSFAYSRIPLVGTLGPEGITFFAGGEAAHARCHALAEARRAAVKRRGRQ